MLSTLFVSAFVMAAPIPAAPSEPAGPAPYVLDLKPEADGKIRLNVIRMEKREIQAGNARNQNVRQVNVAKHAQVELKELENLTVYTADGKEVPVKEALRKLENGGPVVASSDGKKVDPTFLKLFRDDVMVLVSPDLANANARRAGNVIEAPIRGGVQILPAVPGNIQIQVQPLPAQVLPAVEEKAPEKPAVKPAK